MIEIKKLIEKHTPNPLSLYIHIPFCSEICPYCDYYSVVYSRETAERYLRALKDELELWVDTGLNLNDIETIYIGGGTPGILKTSDLTDLTGYLYRYINPDKIIEFTVEMNPENIEKHNFGELLNCGINRISLGVQSLSPRNLSILGREAKPGTIINSLEKLNQVDGLILSCDILFGLDGDGISGATGDLRELLNYEPRHISTYELTLDEGNPLNGYKMSDEEVADEYLRIVDFLADWGFEHYTISDFAKPGSKSRHNLYYFKRSQYLGLGTSSASLIGDVRTTNVSDVGDYITSIRGGETPFTEYEELTDEQSAGEALLLGLMLREGVDIENFQDRYGFNPRELMGERLSEFVSGDYLRMERGRIFLTLKGVLISDEIFGGLV